MEIKKTKLKEGYISAYWDISQAEPRSICYRSGDPLFRELYEVGGDAYRELATRRWLVAHGMDPDFHSPDREKVDKNWVKQQRTIYKQLILSGIYGQSIKTLSERAGVSYADGKAIWDGFIGPMKKVAEFRDANIEYGTKTGYAKTILGEKIPLNKARLFTTANNTVVQNFTAVVLAAFFYNCMERAMSIGINVSSKMLIHDSQTIEFPIKNLFHMDLICRKYFRQACRKYFKCDYKFDWDLMFDLMNHIPYSFNIETGIVDFQLWSERVDYLLDHLATNYSFKVINKDEFDYDDGQGRSRRLIDNGYTHAFMEDDIFRQRKRTNLKIQLTEPLKDIDWWYKKLPETFSEHVNEIKSVSTPRKEGFNYGCRI